MSAFLVTPWHTKAKYLQEVLDALPKPQHWLSMPCSLVRELTAAEFEAEVLFSAPHLQARLPVKLAVLSVLRDYFKPGEGVFSESLARV